MHSSTVDSEPIFCPLTPVTYPPIGRLIQAAAEWLGRLSPGPAQNLKMQAVAGTELCTHFFPEGSTDRLLSLSKYSAWSFQLDDLLESGELGGPAEAATVLLALARIMEAPEAGLLGDLPLAVACADVARDLWSWASPVQMARFTATFRVWMDGFIWESALRERQGDVSLNAYMAMRVLAAGSANAVPMACMAVGLELPARQWHDPAVVAAREAAMAVAVLDNDRYSRAKSVESGDEAPDVVDVVLRRNPGLSPEQALTEAVAIRDRVMALYLRLSERLRRDADEALLTYLRCLDLLITGNLDFGATCLRYVDPTAPAAGLPWSDKPSDSTPGPVPIPTFAWWWDHVDR